MGDGTAHRRRIIEVNRAGAPKPVPAGAPAPAPPAPEPAERAAANDDDEEFYLPIELLPAVRVLKGYGRRMHGNGGLRGAAALERVVEALIPHLGACPELVDVVVEARNEANEIRALALATLLGAEKADD